MYITDTRDILHHAVKYPLSLRDVTDFALCDFEAEPRAAIFPS